MPAKTKKCKPGKTPTGKNGQCVFPKDIKKTKKVRATVSSSPSISSLTHVTPEHQSDNNYMLLTRKNLNKINGVNETPPKKRKPANPKEMSDKVRQKIKDEYQTYWNEFLEDDNNEIYTKLKKVAKREYSKDARLAEFQEEFFQFFMKNDKRLVDKRYINNLYSKKYHDVLVQLREKVDTK